MNTAAAFPEPLVSDTPLPFHDLCARIHDRIAAFLAAEGVSDRVKSVQHQTRVSLDVIDQALGQYRWVTMERGGANGEAAPRLTAAVVYQSSR